MNKPIPHLTAEEIGRYCGQKMSPADLLAADRHLAICDVCYAQLSQREGVADKLIVADRAFAPAVEAEVAHLTYEQLAALVDNQLNDIDREIVESHLEFCARCETELRDLRDVAFKMAKPAERVPVAPVSFREKLTARFRVPAFRWAAFALVTVALFAAFALLLIIPLRRERAALQSRVAELERSNQSLSEQADSLQHEIAALREENTVLLQPAPNEALVALNDGDYRITLDRQGKLSGLSLSPHDEQLVKEALQNKRVRFPISLVGLRGVAGTLMGQSSERGFRLLSPVGAVIESNRPLLRWSALEGAESYTVTVFDASLSQVATSGPLTTTQWQVPLPLERGGVYVWQVRAIQNGRETVAPAAEAERVTFKVLEQTKLAEIERARKSYAGSHLLMGLIYAEAGLLEDAAREFNVLLQANPQSLVARKLLASVNAWRR